MRNLLSGLVSGAGLVILWAVLTKPKRRTVTRTRLRHDLRLSVDKALNNPFAEHWLRMPEKGWSGWTDASNLYVHWA